MKYRVYRCFVRVYLFIQEDEVYPFDPVVPLVSVALWSRGIDAKVECE